MSNRKQYKPEFEAKVKALHAKLGELTAANGAGNMRHAPGMTASCIWSPS